MFVDSCFLLFLSVKLRIKSSIRINPDLLLIFAPRQAPPPLQKPAAPSTAPSVQPAQGESSQCSELSGYRLPQSPPSQRVAAVLGSELPHAFLPSDPGQWNMEDVYEFISALPGEWSRTHSIGQHLSVQKVLEAPPLSELCQVKGEEPHTAGKPRQR